MLLLITWLPRQVLQVGRLKRLRLYSVARTIALLLALWVPPVLWTVNVSVRAGLGVVMTFLACVNRMVVEKYLARGIVLVATRFRLQMRSTSGVTLRQCRLLVRTGLGMKLRLRARTPTSGATFVALLKLQVHILWANDG